MRSQLSDNRLSGARKIGVLNGRKAFLGFVGLKDTVDFYSFKLTERSSFNLSLSKLQNNVDVFLRKGARVISRSVKGGKKPEAIRTTLDTGTYYIQVKQKSGNSRYKLTLNAAPLAASSPSPSPAPIPSPSPIPSSRRALSFRGSAAPGLGFVDLNTGIASSLVITGPAAGVAMSDVAQFGNDLYATSYADDLYKVDGTTGNSTFIGNLGLISATTNPYAAGLAFTPSGVLYATTANADNLGQTSPNGLYTIDLTTGKASLVAAFPSKQDAEDIVYDTVTGRFIGVGSMVAGDSTLYSIGLAGDFQSLGSTGFLGVEGLLFDNGILYGFTGSSNRSQIVFNGLRAGNTLATRTNFVTETRGIISGAA
jgi:hypothetical protein